MVLGNRVLSIAILLILSGWAISASAWQQQVDYEIQVRLDDINHHVSGTQHVVYQNKSPDTLDIIYFHLYPNAFENKRTAFAKEAYKAGEDAFQYSGKADRGRLNILQLYGGNVSSYEVDGTLMEVYLEKPLPPGSRTVIFMEFDLKLPRIFHRLGHIGRHYELTQWYPKACVYDSAGWHKDTYHYLGEFYSNFGEYRVKISAPERYIIAATGDKVAEAYSPVEPGEVVRKIHSCKAQNVHDFVWVADKKYTVDSTYAGNTLIELYILPGHEKHWRNVAGWAVQAMEYYSDWYCEYPYSNLKIIDVNGSPGAGMEYPQAVLISGNSLPFTRLHEAQVAHEIAHQWFYGMLGNNEIDQAFLDEGFATFSEIRYFQEKYGEDDNLIDIPDWIPFDIKITDYDYSIYNYYLLASTETDIPLNTPAYEYADRPFSYGTYYYKGALVLFALRDYMGEDAFNAALRQYCFEFKFKHPTVADFERICAQFCRKDLGWFFDQWIETDKKVDLNLKKVKVNKTFNPADSSRGFRTDVYLTRKTEGYMPADVVLKEKNGKVHTQLWENSEFEHEVVSFFTESKPENIAVDPENKSLDYYRWNNFHPRKVRFHFLFEKPDMEAYQLFFIPYAWAVPPDYYILGGFLQGRQFFDSGPILGKHQWMLFMGYSFDEQTLQHYFNYSTPLGAMGKFTRITGGWYRSVEMQQVYGGFQFNYMDYPFGATETHTLDFLIAHTHYSPAFTSDPRDVDIGGFSSIGLDYNYSGRRIKFGNSLRLKAELGKDTRNDVFEFAKTSAEVQNYIRLTSRIKIFERLYIGYARGAIPAQERFFFSGKLFPEKLMAATWSNVGDLSSQEHWHIWGDGNMRGYYGRHLKGKFIYSMSFEQDLPLPPVYLFFDAGDIANHPEKVRINRIKSDFGFGIKLFGLLRVDFPFWVSHPEEPGEYWDFRIIAGFTRGIQ
ncbi:MAG: hypothetical protein GF307_04595 [candidate division Zixibacteria bacterium]|nr:hypothetical protein [candidate division Zixibacteria bacterium]